MKVKRIHIEEYGAWRNLDLPVSSDGLTVIYGPNEAGKSTLRRFLRDVFYGFQNQEELTDTIETRSGFAVVEYEGKEYQIARSAIGNESGYLEITGPTGEKTDQAFLDEILSGVSEDVFDSVFAVGLKELQELATLHGDEVAERVYGASLGSEGRKILTASKKAVTSKNGIWNSESNSGTLMKITERRSETIRQLRKLGDQQSMYLDLLEEHYSIEAKINDQKKRQTGLQYELNGHQFLARVWTPWNRERRLREEYNRLPKLRKLPKNALKRFDEIEMELKQLGNKREKIKAELDDLKSRILHTDQLNFYSDNGGTIQSFLNQRTWLEEAEQRYGMTSNEVDRLQKEWNEKFALLGPDWTEERLDRVNFSPALQIQLNDAARRYQSALGQRSRHQKKYKKLSAKAGVREKQLISAVKQLRIQSLPAGIRETKDRIALLERRAALRLNEQELANKQKFSQSLVSTIETKKPIIPEFFNSLVVAWIVLSLICSVAGYVLETPPAILVGIILAMMGVAYFFVAKAIEIQSRKKKTETTHQSLFTQNDHLSLNSVRNELFQLDEQARFNDGPVLGDAEALNRAYQLLAELHKLEEEDKSIQEMRRSLSLARSNRAKYQTKVNDARQKWCDLLKQIGFVETLKTKDALLTWQLAFDAYQARENLRRAKDSLDYQGEDINAFRNRISQFGQSYLTDSNADWDVNSLLSQWEVDLQGYQSEKEKQTSWKKQISRLRKESNTLTRQINLYRRKRKSLLAAAKVKSRDELEEFLSLRIRRRQLKEELELAVLEVQEVASSEPNLAVVEEDLLAYDAAKNREHIELLSMELEDLVKDLQTSHATLGRIHRDMEALETDRSEVELRFQRQKTDDELVEETEKWLGASLAGESVSHLRQHYEKSSQPKTLKNASWYLNRLTKGSYKSVWTPLGARELRVEHDDDSNYDVSQLSDGTREQLFLSIRLAMIEEMTQKGVELPVILDDIFVNFDHKRTKAAVSALIDFAEKGQQIFMFTCHEHLAKQFDKKGVEPIQLPDRIKNRLESRIVDEQAFEEKTTK